MEINDKMVDAAFEEFASKTIWNRNAMRAALEAALGARGGDAPKIIKDLLQGGDGQPCDCFRCKAAACIEYLAGALKNFAMIEMPSQEPDHWPIFGKKAGMGWPIVGDFRVARATLEKWGLK